MLRIKSYLKFKIRNILSQDIKEVYKLLVANRPYVGLNSRYTYFLLAKDFSDTCVVAEQDNKVVGFSSGYVPKRKARYFLQLGSCSARRLSWTRPSKTDASFPN